MIFVEAIPNDILLSLLEKVCEKVGRAFVFNVIAYRKLLYHEYETEFLNSIRPCYSSKKRFYIDRKLTYNGMTTILRQICNHNNIAYESRMRYYCSKYEVEYLIFLVPETD